MRRLLGCDACQLYLRDGEDGRLELVASEPPGEPPAASVERRATLRDGRDELGELVASSDEARAFRGQDDELLQAVANQVALALRKAELIERLTAENVVRDLFEALAAGAVDVAEARAHAAGCDLDARTSSSTSSRCAEATTSARGRPSPSASRRACARWPGVLCDAGREALRALLPLPWGAEDAEVETLCGSPGRARGERGVHIGVSALRRGARDGGHSLREAVDAGRIAGALTPAGGALTYGGLGPYRYLVHLPLEHAPRDRQCAAVERLLDYDERRQTHLLATLEQYLGDRRSGATTARKLFIHPNTLRQRLDRIEKLAGLDLGAEDLLSLELAVKLVRLRPGADAGRPATP